MDLHINHQQQRSNISLNMSPFIIKNINKNKKTSGILGKKPTYKKHRDD